MAPEATTLRIERENVLLRAHFTSTEKAGSLPAYEAFEAAAEDAGCRGATVLRAVEGIAAGGRRLRPAVLAPSEELPLVVEVIDAPGRIAALVARAAPLLRGRLVTRERAGVVLHRRSAGGPPAEEPAAAGGEVGVERSEPGVLVRVFLSESDRRGGRPLARAILDLAAEAGLEMALVLKGAAGFGTHRREHTGKGETASLDQPLVLECAGTEARVAGFLPRLDAVLEEGLVTVEKVTLLRIGA